MLEVLMGRANTGKSRAVLERMRERREARPQLLLVPEHASHEAERDVCRFCGPTGGGAAEALSIRRLAFRVLSGTGAGAAPPLDAGGKLLTMFLSLGEVLPRLKVYARPSRRAAFLQELVSLCDELTAFRVRPEDLERAAAGEKGLSGDRARDAAVIYAAYRSRLEQMGCRDLTERMLEQVEASGLLDGRDVYFDGFAYFTAQERQLIAAALKRAHSVTVTVLGDAGGLEVFSQGVKTRDQLVRLAAGTGAKCRVTCLSAPAPENAAGYLAERFFGPSEPWEGDCGGVELCRCADMVRETEYVAARILELVRAEGCRFRDVAVAARNMDEYEAVIENVFARYGVPVYLSRRSDVLEKPALSLLAGALDAVTGGYEYEDMFRFLKTGLAGLTAAECDELENYAVTWDVHGSMWTRPEDWTANPDGWQETFTPRQRERLAHINELRRRVSGPLKRLSDGLRASPGAAGKLTALWRFLDELDLAAKLKERAALLEREGQLQTAREYGQLWELLCSVMDQFAEVLGDETLDADEFARLFKLVLTQYDVGTIPVGLDQVQASQITRNDRHRVKYLFLMGANDNVLPAAPPAPGILGREDRERLRREGIELAPAGDEAFQLELLNLYAALAQPTERLIVTWPAAGVNGEPLRPSFVVGRARALLPGVRIADGTEERDARLAAPVPALELAGAPGGGELRRFFEEDGRYASRLAAMDRAAAMGEGRLTPAAAEALYGRVYRMSASRIDQAQSCHFAYFMRYGLKARERESAGFDAGRVGTFLHFVLERVLRGASEKKRDLTDEELRDLRETAVSEYMRDALPDFDARDERFKYIFRRLRRTVAVIVENVYEEVRESDFTPVAFELEFGGEGRLPAIVIRAPGGGSLSVSGKVDRVDGWLKDGRLYLRVVDYKSGRKAFDLSDVRYGLNIQMLLYLFALQREGSALFGREVVPAGVLYLPARDVLVSLGREATEEQVRRALDRELRRSGMVLGEPEVLRAMEHSALESPRFLPLSLGKDGSVTGGVASAEELGRLGRYVEKLLESIAGELRAGNVDADPCGRGENDSACTRCAFASACHFALGSRPLRLIRPTTPQAFWAHVDKTIGGDSPCPSV